MSPGISHIPEELVEAILRHIRDSTTNRDFWNYLTTCKQWYRIGFSMVVSLSYSTSVLVNSHQRRHSIEVEDTENIEVKGDFRPRLPQGIDISELRSLTIHVLHARVASKSRSISGDFFHSLANTVRTTRKLTTFSLKFAQDGWDFPSKDVPAVPQSKIARLVEGLPRSILSLDIDTASMDVPPSMDILEHREDDHLCVQIARILPRLHHLRMRVRHYCAAIYSYTGIYSTNCNSRTSSACKLWKTKSLVLWIPRDTTYADTSFASNYVQFLEPSKNHFPNLTYYRIIHIDNMPSTNDNVRNCWLRSHKASSNEELKSVRMREVLPRTTSALLEPRCTEHNQIQECARRYFWLRAPTILEKWIPVPAYVAEWALEEEGRWVQSCHRGSRYPSLERSEDKRTVWKEILEPAEGEPDQHFERQIERLGSFPCIFPHCSEHFDGLDCLRKHHADVHPRHPNEKVVNGAIPCPSFGCDRVGLWGFFSRVDLEQHLLGHHKELCTER